MRASQELRWKQRIKENEERRRRYDEASKRLELEEKDKAQRVLEVRRAERARMDDLMRNPAQEPAPPQKPILRKGAGAVLRSPPKAGSNCWSSRCDTRPATVPAQGSPASASARSPACSPVRAATACAERPRREWREGLKQFIAGQREATRPMPQQGASPAVDDAKAALSWQDLKMAAEAGFEQLLKMQEAAARQQANPGLRRPGMTRAKGGGGSTAEAWVGPAQGFVADAHMQNNSQHSAGPAEEPAARASDSTGVCSPPVSKWVARRQQPMTAAEASSAIQPQQATSSTFVHRYDAQKDQTDAHIEHQLPQPQQQKDAAAISLLQPADPAGVPCEQPAAATGYSAEPHPASGSLQWDLLVHGSAAGAQFNTSCPAEQQAVSFALLADHNEQQHLTAAAASAAAALRASMDQLHRSTEQARGAAPAAGCAEGPQHSLDEPSQAMQHHSSRGSTADGLDTLSGSATQQGNSCSDIHQHSPSNGSAGSELSSPEPSAADAAAQSAGAAVSCPKHAAPIVPFVGHHVDQTLTGDKLQPRSCSARQSQCSADGQLQQQQQWVGSWEQFGHGNTHISARAPARAAASSSSLLAASSASTPSPDGARSTPAPAQQCQQVQEQAQLLGRVEEEQQEQSCQQHMHDGATVDQRGNGVVTSAPSKQATASAGAGNEQQEHDSVLTAATEVSVNAPADHNATLDALLEEAKQLAALRRAVGAEFAAMGRSRMAAAMGAYEPEPAPSIDAAEGTPQHQQLMQAQAQSEPVAMVFQRHQQPPLHQQPGYGPAPAPAAAPAAAPVAAKAVRLAEDLGSAHGAYGGDWADSLSNSVQSGLAARSPAAAAEATQQPQVQTAAPAVSAAAVQQPVRPAVQALCGGDVEMLPLKQLGQQRQQQQQQQLLQQDSVWLPTLSPPQERHQQLCGPHAVEHGPDKQLSQLTLSRCGDTVLGLSPLQQVTGNSGSQKQMCFTSNPLYLSAPKSLSQDLALHGIAAVQQACLDKLGPSQAQVLDQQQLLKYHHHQQQQQPLVMVQQQHQLPNLQQQEQQQQQCHQHHQQQQGTPHHDQQQQQQQPSQVQHAWLVPHTQNQLLQQQQQQQQRQEEEEEEEKHVARPMSAAGLQQRVALYADHTCSQALGDLQQPCWPGGSGSYQQAMGPAHEVDCQLYATAMVAQRQQQLQLQQLATEQRQDKQQLVPAGWGPAAGSLGPNRPSDQQMMDTADLFSQWGYQHQHCPVHAAPSAATAAAGYTEMSWQDLSAQPPPYMAISGNMRNGVGQEQLFTSRQHSNPAVACTNQPVAVGAGCIDTSPADGAVPPCHASSAASGPGGESGSRFLSKLASKARSAVKSAVGRMAVGSANHLLQQQQQQASQVPPKSPRHPCTQAAADQGSYVAAALMAQQRAEAEAAERERIKTAAEAAKQATARRAAAERAEAQRSAADQAAQNSKPAPVVIGSYARQQAAAQRQQQAKQGSYHALAKADTDQQLDSCSDPVGVPYTTATAAVTAPSTAATPGSCAKQLSKRAACMPQAPLQPADRNSSPRRKAVHPSTVPTAAAAASVQMHAAASPTESGVLARAMDQYSQVSKIPVAPGTHPSTQPQAAGDNAASHSMRRAMLSLVQQRQHVSQHQPPAAGGLQYHADRCDDDWHHLERELQFDTDADEAATAAGSSSHGYWGQQQQQQQKHMHARQQPTAQQQQQMPGLLLPPLVDPLQSASAQGVQEPPKSPMWAAVEAAAAAATAARGQQQDGTAAVSRVTGRQQHARTQLPQAKLGVAAKLRPLPSAAVPPAGTSWRKGLPGAASAQSSAAAAAASAGNSALRGAAGKVSTQGQRLPCSAPASGPQARVIAAPQHQQHPSRLSLEEANLLAELQQLDQRMHHTPEDQQRDAPPCTAKLPAMAPAGSPSKHGGNTAKASPGGRSPGRVAVMTAPAQRGSSSAVVKPAAVHGAGRKSSAGSSSGCDVPPASARQQQQQAKTSKLAKLVSVPRAVAAAPGKARAASPQEAPPGSPSAAAAAGSAFPPWSVPAGMPAAADPRLAYQMAHAGMFPASGGAMGRQGYWLGPDPGMMQHAWPGAMWPEGSGAAGTGAAWQRGAMTGKFSSQVPNAGSNPGMQLQGLMQWQHEPGNAWQQQQGQPLRWPGQLQPQFAVGPQQACHHHHLQHPGALRAGSQGGYATHHTGAGGGMMSQQLSRQVAGMLMPHQVQGMPPPLTAPSIMHQAPGSPLLPTLHYQETVMRNRTSSSSSGHGYQGRGCDGSGAGSSGVGSRWSSAGSCSSCSSRGAQGNDGGAAGWAARVSYEAANVWPPRGVEKSILSGIKGGGRGARGEGDGDIVVYNAHLLLS